MPVGDAVEARLRLKKGDYYFAIKADTGAASTRCELEFPVAKSVAETLLPYCPDKVEKMRHTILAHGRVWEVNEFGGANKGLSTAEIELPKTGWLSTSLNGSVRK